MIIRFLQITRTFIGILVLLVGGNAWGQTPNGTLDFGNPTNGTSATTVNTGFNVVRVGTQGGGFTLQNPGQPIGTQGELRGVAPTGGSINSIGITNTGFGTANTTFTISFDLYLSGGSSGTWYFFAGNGTSFDSPQTTGFTSNQIFTGLRWAFGASNTITTNNRNAGNWNTTGISGTPFAQNTAYKVVIVGNNSNSTVNYGSNSVASNTFDLWVNDVLVGDDLAKGQLGNNSNINAFRFYGESSTGNVAQLALDNVVWYSSAVNLIVQSPTISTTGTLAAINTTYGTTSANTSFNVSGTNMEAGISVNPPAGFQVSTTADFSSNVGTNGNPITVGAAGTIASTTIYVRIPSTTNAGTYSGNIVLTSTNATTVNVATVSSTVSKATPTITTPPTATAINLGQSLSASALDGGTASVAGTFAFTNPNTTPTETGTFVADITFTPTDTDNYNNATGTVNVLVNAPTTPTIVVTDVSVSALSTTYGTPSTAFTFKVSASTLSDPLVITPPTGFEVSITSASSGYGINQSITPISGTVSLTDVFVRLAATTNAGAYSGDVTITSTGAVTQNVATQTSTVSPKALTITGLTASNKIYDATTSVTVTGTPTYVGLENSESFSVTGTVTWAFDTKTVGNNKNLVRTGDYNAPSANYTVTQPSLTASITPKTLAVAGISINNKPFDNTTTATISGTAVLGGVESGDTVTLGGTPNAVFASVNVANNIAVTVTGYTISGTDASNYTLQQPQGLTASITKATQTITFNAFPALNINSAAVDLNTLASTTSGLTLIYTSSNPAVATISGNTMTIVGAGTTTITASQAGNTNYLPAVDATQVATVSAAPVLIAGWDFTGESSVPTSTADIFNNNLSQAPILTRGTGASQSAGNNSFRTTGFQNNGISTNNTDYFETTITSTTSTITLSSIEARFAGTGTFFASPGVSSQFAFSLDGVNFTLIGSQITSTSLNLQFDLSGVVALQNVTPGTVITLRYYASGQTTTGGWGFNSPNQNDLGLAINGFVVTPITWNGTAWNNTTGPTIDDDAVIAGEFDSTSSLSAKNLTIQAETGFTLNAGHTLTLSGALVNEGTVDNVVFESDSQFVQTTNATNTGAVTIKRNTVFKRLDIPFWSSPVTGQIIKQFSPNTLDNRFFTYNEQINNWEVLPNVAAHAMIPAKGYAIRTPNNHAVENEDWTGVFVGVPNNGNYTFPVSSQHASARYNLVGNPYPSALNLRAFYSENSGKIINKFYFMEHTLATPAPSGQTNYGVLTISPVNASENLYAPASSPMLTGTALTTFTQNEVVQPGQGFFVRAIAGATGDLVFNNSMRSTTGGAFFRQNTNAEDDNEFDMFRVKMVSPNNFLNTSVVAYFDYASDDIDVMDTGGLGSPLYTLLGTNRFVIQGLATPFNPSSTIPMGVNVGVAGIYHFGISEVKGLFTNQQYVLLHDTQLGVYHNISLTDYEVELNTLGANDNRFYLVFVPMLSVDNPEVTKGAIKMFVKDDVVQLKLLAQGAISQVKVYDLTGKLNAVIREGESSQYWKLQDLQASKSIRLFEVTLENGKTEIIKLFY